MTQIHPDNVGKWVVLDDVQFARDALGKTYAGEAFDTFDGERRLVNCVNQRAVILSSSAFATFKSLAVDSLSGKVCGVLTRDYYNEKYILKINSSDDIVFDSERCDLPFDATFEHVFWAVLKCPVGKMKFRKEANIGKSMKMPIPWGNRFG